MDRSNPALSRSRYEDAARAVAGGEAMTIAGAAGKALILLVLLGLSVGYTWHQLSIGAIQNPRTLMIASIIAGLVVAMIGIFKPRTTPYIAPIYAVIEGMALAVISAYTNAAYPGLPLMAVGLTVCVTLVMLTLYTTRVLQATPAMWRMVTIATGGIMVFYLLSFGLSFAGIQMPLIHSGGPLGIAFSLFVVGLAAFNLVLDFSVIEDGAKSGAPKYMEWYGAFALLITLVWLYIELLRLLRKVQR
jgi:uncharacterized YccA/Bax inhibitor family protein